jgi:hypothetical protein
MTGYFDDPEATRQVLSHDGWFNTGDIAYRIGRNIVITGREKDMIIINGRNIWPQDLEYLAESQPEVRSGNASAFSVADPSGYEKAVLVIQCREQDESLRADLKKRVHKLVRRGFGIDCFIELVPRHTLPRTTSGKLSRSRARKDFLNRMALSGKQPSKAARIIEKHFTLNHTLKGTDHAFSLEPTGLRKMVRDLHRCHVANGDGVKRVYETEVTPIMKMGKKLVAASDLPAGYAIKPEDIAIKSPGDGLAPCEFDKVVGRTTICELKADEALNFEVLNGAKYRIKAVG